MKGMALLVSVALLGGNVPIGWVSHSGPEHDPHCLYSQPGWVVSVVNGTIVTTKASARRSQAEEPKLLRLPGGSLVGENRGEFGGSLRWQPSGRRSGLELLDENVVAIIRAGSGSGALVFTGLAHMMSDYGSVFSVTLERGKPRVKKVAELGSAPLLVESSRDGSAFIVTRSWLLRLLPTGRVERLCAVEFGRLHVNSIAATSEKEVYVGMTLFISRLQLSQGGTCNVEWFVKEDCQRFDVKEFECVCAP
jgi:hypothetical protein